MSNPPNPFLESHVDWEGEPPPAALEVFEEQARSALQKNDSPDVGFRFGLNPYRGCYHGCAYCYARRTHEYLGWGAGTDFERKIVVKTNIAEVLRSELGRRSWCGETIVFSGNTDCYQPLEASFRLTRACLEVCLEHHNPVGIVTKGALIRRDVDVLAALAERAQVRVMMSVPIIDEAMARKLEPYASPPAKRLAALGTLADAGVPCGVMVAPVIPGVNDASVPEVLRQARDAGARWAVMTLLRLPGSVRQVFLARLAHELPARARKVENAVREMRGGAMNEVAFGARMRGVGPRYHAIEALFERERARLGFELEPEGQAGDRRDEPGAKASRRPRRQLELFEP